MWMNRMDIEEAKDIFKNDPVLGPATLFLYDYQELIDDNSDGWSSWMHGTKCANDLMELIDKSLTARRRCGMWSDPDAIQKPTRKEVEAACKKVTNFVLRHDGLQSRNVQPPVLAKEVQLRLI